MLRYRIQDSFQVLLVNTENLSIDFLFRCVRLITLTFLKYAPQARERGFTSLSLLIDFKLTHINVSGGFVKVTIDFRKKKSLIL